MISSISKHLSSRHPDTFPSVSVLLRQSLVWRAWPGLAVTPDFCPPLLQEFLNFSRQTVEFLLKVCLHGSLQLEKDTEIDV